MPIELNSNNNYSFLLWSASSKSKVQPKCRDVVKTYTSNDLVFVKCFFNVCFETIYRFIKCVRYYLLSRLRPICILSCIISKQMHSQIVCECIHSIQYIVLFMRKCSSVPCTISTTITMSQQPLSEWSHVSVIWNSAHFQLQVSTCLHGSVVCYRLNNE